MADSLPMEIASTIQSASITHHPDINRDLNPSTAASKKEPVTISHEHFEDEDEYGIDGEEEEEDDIPYNVIRPIPRGHGVPPLPDLRFEQSYLASISHTSSPYKIAWITARDQLLFPLIQGTIWSLLQLGWRHWNLRANLQGTDLGSRIRRWWYNTNNWKLPPLSDSISNMKTRVSNMTKDKNLAREMGEFYKFQT